MYNVASSPSQDLYGIEEVFMQVRHPNSNIDKFSMHLADDRILAPLAAFLPDMMGLHGAHLVRVPEAYYSDPSDAKDEDYIRQTMSKHEQVIQDTRTSERHLLRIVLPEATVYSVIRNFFMELGGLTEPIL